MNQQEYCIGGVMVLIGNYDASGIVAQIKSCYDSIIEEPTEATWLTLLDHRQNTISLVVISEANTSFSLLESTQKHTLLSRGKDLNLNFLFKAPNGRISGFRAGHVPHIDHIFAFKAMKKDKRRFLPIEVNAIVIPPWAMRSLAEEDVPCFWCNYTIPGNLRTPFVPWSADEWTPNNHHLWNEAFKSKVWLILRLHNVEGTLFSTLNEHYLHMIIRILALDNPLFI